jgi:hypothetical protein
MAPVHGSRIMKRTGTDWAGIKCSKHHSISAKQEVEQKRVHEEKN